ncbi:uncharacterized protein LOC143913451 [Arctopsyche grandis]|uniref:uncharacterized protein LOC143913451 n=1 Tax=Arctopsyche grandis TaxID=121162 RepID=UPI00406D7874
MKNYVRSINMIWSDFTTWLRRTVCPTSVDTPQPPADGKATFEEALAFTKFGKFNILLMAFAIPASIASIYDTTTMSYVITSAECDLKLSMMQKGSLNAMAHMGMIACAFISGYITDTLGRRRTLVFGFLLDALCNFTSMFSTSFLMLAVLKFIAGFLMSGPCTVIISCLSEFFSKEMRPMFVMYVGICFSLGSFTIPFIAWLILADPSDINISSTFVIHSWQMFIAVCCLPSLLSGFLALALPESPRFLAAMGNTDEALKVLRKVYAINTGCPADTYPIKQLYSIGDDSKQIEDVNDKEKCEKEKKCKKGNMAALRGGLNQLRPLLRRPHITILLLVFVIEYGCISGATLRLWLPQLFKMMSENVEGPLCDMISLRNNVSILEVVVPEAGCKPISINPETFENAAIVAGIQVVLCGLASFAINALGKKNLLMSTLFIAGVCCSSLYLCTSAKQATILAAITVAFSAISSNATISVLIDLIPTSLRATASSCTLMVGRIGSVIGNMIFPILLALGCLPAFLSLGCLLIGCSVFSLLLPSPRKEIT